MNTAQYQTIVAAPGFALGVQCDGDEITTLDFLEPRPEQAPLHHWLPKQSVSSRPTSPIPVLSSACHSARSAPLFNVASGSRFQPFLPARSTLTVNWQKPSKMRHAPSVRLVARIFTRS